MGHVISGHYCHFGLIMIYLDEVIVFVRAFFLTDNVMDDNAFCGFMSKLVIMMTKCHHLETPASFFDSQFPYSLREWVRKP